jgi:LuxR family maltose regulon positive regulatory protein
MVTPLLLLVLDDYHLLGAQPVHALQTFLLVHSPPQLRFAVATRADPPWPVARLRARDQVTEIRERDLRFTLQADRSGVRAGAGVLRDQGRGSSGQSLVRMV